MYSWQQFTEDAAIILGGGAEGRKKATELLNNQKFLAVAGGTLLGVVLLYGIRKIYQRSGSSPAIRKSRLSTHDLCKETKGPNTTELNHAVNNLENMADNCVETKMANCTVGELGDAVSQKLTESEIPVVKETLDKDSELKSTSPGEAEISQSNDSDQYSPKHLENGSDEQIVENGHDAPKKRDTVLNEKLLKYYDSYVLIPEANIKILDTILEDFKDMFGRCCEELMPNHNLRGLETAGSSHIGLQVVQLDGADIHVSLELDSALWALVDAGQSVMSAHGYWLIKRQQVEFFSHGTSKYDKYLTADYLTPNKILSTFLDMINRVAKWSDEYKVQAEVVGPAVTLKVFYENSRQEKQKIILDFIPSVTLNGVTVVAKPHPMGEYDASFANLWRQSFESEENKLILADNPEGNVAPKCLKIIKAIRKSFPYHLGILNSYIYKNAVLLLLKQEEDWAEEALGERFVDVLGILESSLSTHNMAHWCCPQQNLLSHFNPGLLDFMAASIKDVLQSGQYDGLLQIPQ